jgi:hypothetical protein
MTVVVGARNLFKADAGVVRVAAGSILRREQGRVLE